MTEATPSDHLPPHLLAQADQLQAAAKEFADADEALIEVIQVLPDPGEGFWDDAEGPGQHETR